MSLSLIERLSQLIRAISAAAQRPAAIQRCIDGLFDNPDIFDSVVVLRGGYAGSPFVIASACGCSGENARNWMRWPLRRLFVEMKPARILEPFSPGRSALAIPFSYGEERYVVVARLHGPLDDSAHRAFFETLESVTVPSIDRAVRASDSFPDISLEPAIVAFALATDLRSSIREAITRRGWQVDCIDVFAEFTRSLRRSPPDIVMVDVSKLEYSIDAITSIHRIADYGPLRMLAFGAQAELPSTSIPLVDRVLPRDAAPSEIFRTVKELALKSHSLGRAFATEADTAARRMASGTLTLQELADFAAERAATILGGWATCVLVNDYGAVFRAEYPCSSSPVLTAIPRAFLNGSRNYESEFRDTFFDDVSDDFIERQALSDLKPLSTATVPLIAGNGRQCGVVIACATARRAAAQTFESLDNFADVVTDRFDRLQPSRIGVPELRKDRLWDRLHDRMLHVNVYRSRGCTTPWRYRIFDGAWALLTLGIRDDSSLIRQLHRDRRGAAIPPPPRLREFAGEDSCFAATIDFSMRSMRYSSRGFSPPMFAKNTGPRGLAAGSSRENSGIATLASGGTIVCDDALWRWSRGRHNSMDGLTEALDRETPSGLASVVTLD